MHIVEPASPQPPSAHRRRKRPFGLFAILVLLSLQALLGVLLGIALALVFASGRPDLWASLEPNLWDVVSAFILMMITAVVVVGLWRFRKWAWYGTLLLLAYWMATDVTGYFAGEPDYVSMFLNVAMVFYLNQREVKELFESPRPQAGVAV